MTEARRRRLLITRPAADAAGLVRQLADHGIDSLVQPMLAIRFVDAPPLLLDGVQALAATSGNGIRAFVHRQRQTGRPAALPVFAVGEATARLAREAGFGRVESAAGDVEALAALITARLDPAGGAILHVAASQVAGDLAGRLAAAGFACRREILYAAEPATALAEGVTTALRAGTIDGVLLFSPRTAAAFTALIGAAGLASAAHRLTAYCLSRAVADRLAPLACRQARIAASPTEAALLAAVLADTTRG